MKKLLALLLVILTAFSFVGCGSDSKKAEKPETEIKQETNDDTVEAGSIEEYIATLSGKTLERFTQLWSSLDGLCERLESNIKKNDFEFECEFNPLDKESIPEEVYEIGDFDEIKLYSTYDEHEYLMKISGQDVILYIDDTLCYPINESYSTIDAYVKKYITD